MKRHWFPGIRYQPIRYQVSGITISTIWPLSMGLLWIARMPNGTSRVFNLTWLILWPPVSSLSLRPCHLSNLLPPVGNFLGWTASRPSCNFWIAAECLLGFVLVGRCCLLAPFPCVSFAFALLGSLPAIIAESLHVLHAAHFSHGVSWFTWQLVGEGTQKKECNKKRGVTF